MTDPNKNALPVFLIQESEEFIAEDISGCLKAMGPCKVVHVRKPDEIAAALAQERDVSVAVLELTYIEAIESGAVQALIVAGARIILTKDGVDELRGRSMGWGMLARPFTDAMIRAEFAGQGVEVNPGYMADPLPHVDRPL